MLCWPVFALNVVLVLWLLLIPFRLVGLVVHAVFALLKAILFLPARLLGGGNGT
jgi:hypothetical protein